jgi:hypothetical protein
MVDLVELVNAFVAKLQAIPELVALLEDNAANIRGYLDEGAINNNQTAAVYQMKPGTVLVMWQETLIAEGTTMSPWSHHVTFMVRAPRGVSNLSVLTAIVNGVPVPGDGQVWRRCEVMAGLMPTNIIDITREPDSEGVDYYSVMTETPETGDFAS